MNSIPLLAAPARRRAWLAAAALSILLAACGGGDDDDKGRAEMRVLNATPDLAAMDLTIDNDDIAESLHAGGLAPGATSAYAGLEEASYTLRLKRAGGNTALAALSMSLVKDKRFTVVAHGREGRVALSILADDEEAPDTNRAKLRIFNTSSDSGTVDVYLTDATTSLDEVSPTYPALDAGRVSSYVDHPRGSYRLRVTGRDDKSDLRLDLQNVELGDRAILTVLLQPTPGGVLVDAMTFAQQGDPTAQRATQARVRLAAGLTDNAPVTASIGGRTLNVNLRSPSVGNYTLVAAGRPSASIFVAGVAQAVSAPNLVAGGDYTLMLHGPAGAPQLRWIADDNRLPNNASKAKLRLVHGAFGLDSGLTLAKDYLAVANDVAYGEAAAAVQVDPSNDTRIEVTSPLSPNALFLNDDAVLAIGGVYSVFILGSAQQPTGILRRDR